MRVVTEFQLLVSITFFYFFLKPKGNALERSFLAVTYYFGKFCPAWQKIFVNRKSLIGKI